MYSVTYKRPVVTRRRSGWGVDVITFVDACDKRNAADRVRKRTQGVIKIVEITKLD